MRNPSAIGLIGHRHENLEDFADFSEKVTRDSLEDGADWETVQNAAKLRYSL
jgi:hypothetical protein